MTRSFVALSLANNDPPAILKNNDKEEANLIESVDAHKFLAMADFLAAAVESLKRMGPVALKD